MICLIRRSIVTGSSLVGLGLLALLFAVRFTHLSGWWPIEALDTLAFYAFLPFLGVGVMALLLRSRTLAVPSALALCFFVQQFGAPMLGAAGPTGAPVVTARDDRAHVRLMTLNLHAPQDDPTPFFELVCEVSPDVVVFQEVTSDFARDFDAALGHAYPFSATAGAGANHQGSGTWSRLPLGERQALQPTLRGHVMHRVQLLLGPEQIWLYNVHLANPTGENREDGQLAMLRRFDSTYRDAELDWLTDQAEHLDAPFILAGDFNSAAGSRPYRQFPASWRDAFAEVGRGLGHTYPAPAHEEPGDPLRLLMPMVRIDYVLTSRAVQPVRAWTRQLPESDHLAVIVDLEIPAAR